MNPVLSVHKTISVNAGRERAFEVFARRMATWWPLDYHIAPLPAVDVIIEPMACGRWYEQAEDGSTCDWGRVVVWEPPARLVLAWQISADWRPDATIQSEVEVRFSEDGDSRTRIDLEHRRLESFGANAERMRDVFESESGWTGLLRSFAAAAVPTDQAAADTHVATITGDGR